MYLFQTPTQALPYFLAGRLRAWEIRGLSVWRVNGVWGHGASPSAAIREAADRFYLGGVDHYVTADELADLATAGFAVVDNPTPPATGPALAGSAIAGSAVAA